jgi:putative ABC transport system permease protein
LIKNYLKVAFRNLWKNKFYTGLNIVGLSIGLATCLLIMLYVIDELSYDRYNQKSDRIYRINNEIRFGGNYFDLAVAPALMGPTMVRELPQVEQYTRLRWYGGLLIKKNNENINQGNVAWADSTLLDVFSLHLISGNPRKILREPHSLLLTESVAKKFFGRTDVAGRTLTVNDSLIYTVSGVISDVPKQSHFNFEAFVSMSDDPATREENWLSENWNTYVVLKPGSNPKKVELETNKLLLRHTEPLLKQVLNQGVDEFQKNGGFIGASLTPLVDLHLHSNKQAELFGNGSIQFVLIFSGIALLILLIACVNFMNLSTARSANRAREVGVRKVLGSLKKNLVAQFLTESMILSFVALVMAVLMAWLLIPYFNEIAGKSMSIGVLLSPLKISAAILLMILVGLIAGSYPAFYLSAFRPVEVLKGKLAGGFKSSWLRNGLVIFQFFISIGLIIGTIVIYRQLNYIHNKDLGFNREQVLIINNIGVLDTKAPVFRDEISRLTGVKDVTISGYLPVNGWRSNDAFFTSPALDQKTAISMQNWDVDERYLSTLDIKLLQGRNFSKEFLSDSGAIIINEAALKFMGSKQLIGKKIYEIDDVKTKKLKEFNIIGVVKNFNFSSLREVISPLALKLHHSYGSIAVRIHGENIPGLVEQVRSKWKTMAPGQPFDFAFMDEEFNNLYGTEQRMGKLFVSFAVLAIVIACLGLFGLVTYAAEQRTREIGVRKVLGANTSNIVTMISKDFLKLVLLAALLAFPLSWWAMNRWLQDFAYRINISWWVFLIAGILALLIAVVTVSYQAFKAAWQNPVTSLRSE